MHVEIIRTRNSLRIRWTSEAGDRWEVSKSFDLGTRILQDAQIECSAFTTDASKQAGELAEQMDAIFVRPEFFDLVAKSVDYPEDGSPAVIRPRVDDKIYIATQKEN